MQILITLYLSDFHIICQISIIFECCLNYQLIDKLINYCIIAFLMQTVQTVILLGDIPNFYATGIINKY